MQVGRLCRRLKNLLLRCLLPMPWLGGYISRTRPRIHLIVAGATTSSRYCYATWLHHLVHARQLGLNDAPEVVMELGPGSSLGTGLAALLSGAREYYALDLVKHATPEVNLRVFDELVELFQRRERIPDGNEFPRLKGWLESHEFPAHVLDEPRLRNALEPNRLERIRESIRHDAPARACPPPPSVAYVVPWRGNVIGKEFADIIFSSDTMEHLDDLPRAYRAMSLFLKPGGHVSHRVNFRSHNTHPAWNGHWSYGDLRWQWIRNRDVLHINRAPCSKHLDLLREHGFEIRRRLDINHAEAESIPRRQLAHRFRGLSEDDFACQELFVQAVKPHAGSEPAAGV